VKVTTVAFILLAALAGTRARLAPAAVVAGAAAALLLDDLHEHLMLGDAGANVLGGVLGLGVVVSCSTSTRLVVLAVLAGLNVVAERVSFSAIIDRIGVLRALDHAGRHRAGWGGTQPARDEGLPEEP
jgi:UDP-N-acetylmuramyl pentapeptide phosphotransferase/UDP-N-acetylglucosamine-1-phosphate transferase